MLTKRLEMRPIKQFKKKLIPSEPNEDKKEKPENRYTEIGVVKFTSNVLKSSNGRNIQNTDVHKISLLVEKITEFDMNTNSSHPENNSF